MLLIGLGVFVLLLLLTVVLEVRETSRAQRLPLSHPDADKRDLPSPSESSGPAVPEDEIEPEPPAQVATTPPGFETRPVRPMLSRVEALFRERPGMGPWDRIDPHPPEGRFEGRHRTFDGHLTNMYHQFSTFPGAQFVA